MELHFFRDACAAGGITTIKVKPERPFCGDFIWVDGRYIDTAPFFELVTVAVDGRRQIATKRRNLLFFAPVGPPVRTSIFLDGVGLVRMKFDTCRRSMMLVLRNTSGRPLPFAAFVRGFPAPSEGRSAVGGSALMTT